VDEIGSLADLYVTVRPDLSKFGSELKAGFHPIGIKAGGELGNGIKRALGHGLVAVGVAAGVALGGALTKGFGRLSAIENAQAKLTGLGHSAKTVDKIMTSALASVKGTAFGLDEAATVAATAVASGIKPGQDLQRTLKLVADAATIGGTSLNEMGAIFTKVAASNKIQGGTINQLNDRGIPILKLLGDVMHKSQGEVSKLASQGKVDFATFQKAMQQGLGGAAFKSGNTATGAFRNMGAAISRVGAALLKGVFPQIGGGFRTLTKWLDSITPAAERFGKSFGKVMSKVGELLGNVFAGKWAKAGAQLREWGSKVVGWIQNVAAPWLWKTLQLLGAKLEAWIRPRIPGMLARLGEFAQSIFSWIANKGLPMLGTFMGRMGAKLEAWILPRIPGMIANLVRFGIAIQNWIVLKGVPMLIAGAHRMAFNFILSFYREGVRLNLPGKIRGLITDMWNRARATFVGVIAGMRAQGRAVIQGLLDGLKGPWTALTNWVSGIATWIKNHKGPLSLDSTLLAPAGKALMGGLLHGLKIGFGPVGDFVYGISGSIQSIIGKIGSAIGGFFTTPGNLPMGGSNRQIGMVMARAYGWTGNQWNALNALWTGESGWNNRARNPSSGAFGIPQALPPGKMGAAAAGGNAAAQIAWGLSYIKQVYGSPANAYSKWLARSPHWYAGGTLGALPGLAGIAEKGAELVVSPQIRNMGGGGQRVFNARETEALLSDKGRPIQITNNFPTTMSPEAAYAAAGGRVVAALSAAGIT
jgi:tape measure domain-containing protein